MKILLAIAAAAEVAVGLALLVYPPIVIQLLFGADPVGPANVVSRVAGISLIALGVACWPRGAMVQGFMSMLTYNLLVGIYLVLLGISGEWVGPLLWPAAVGHVILTLLLVWARFSGRAQDVSKGA